MHDEGPRVAVVGCGAWGRNLARNASELGALAAVVDAHPATASSVAAGHHVPARPLDDVLADPAIDGVMVAVPAAQHHDVAAAALRAGKHVFVEKPLSLTLADAEDLCGLADQTGRVLMVGHLLRYHPAFRRLKELCDAGELGRVRYLYSNRLNLGRIRREEDILWSFAPHDISMILALVRAEPTSVSAVGANYLHGDIADVTTTYLSFAGGERAHVFVSWLHPFKDQKLVVIGERAMAVFDDTAHWDRKLVLYRHSIDWREGMPEPVRSDPEPLDVTPAEPLAEECRHFLDCMAGSVTPLTDGAEGIRVLRVLTAAASSMRASDALLQPPAHHADNRSTIAATAVIHPTAQVHESAYVDDGVAIGARTRIWHFCHVLDGTVVGEDCTIGQNVMIGPAVTVGNRCRIQNNVSIYRGVRLDDGVFCGPSCVFTNVTNPRAEVDRKAEFAATHVGRGATIGANATIVCGNSIGAHAFVAAGAVVTHDVPPHALVAGVPARRTGWVSHDGEVLGDDLVCPRSGRKYRLVDDESLEEIV